MKKKYEEIILSKTLYIVSTPIGNLEDISYRAVKILKNVNIIAVENIKHTSILLKNYNIKNKIIKISKEKKIFKKLKTGNSVAIVSNAGTPLINDPGYSLVKYCKKNNIKIIPIPGACAAISALISSGIKTNKFCYEGFLPKSKSKKNKTLKKLKYETRTIILYESPKRIIKTLEDITKKIGKKRQLVIAREITKKWESIIGSSSENMLKLIKKNKLYQKGEIVIVIEGNRNKKNKKLTTQIIESISVLKDFVGNKKAIKIISKIFKIQKKILYKYNIKNEKK
ncbi:16S rRNA (cytidine(1402)-2'-O)-methyltransferase [Buchnera aphidicola (Taiwanaphis decaspermi)]|uniref:16S rRNA (cytidine(1402)-2'-O)-methyltransferase n=1 Tax=Buchnera aphidicola TaxID=9 RepID=UPI0031B8986D